MADDPVVTVTDATFSDVVLDIVGITERRETLDFTRASAGVILRF